MNMKDVCKLLTKNLDDIITDSFYDDDDGGYIELFIENPDDSNKNIQIEIDSTYFGFSYCCYDELYDYDGNEEENINRMCEKIRSITGKCLCVVEIITQEDNLYKLQNITSIDNSALASLIADETDGATDGSVKIILWNTSIKKDFSYDGEEYVFF